MAYIAGAYKITELGTMDPSEFNSAKILVAAGGYSKQYPLSAVAQQAGQDPRVDELSVVIDELSGTVGDIDQTVSEQTETIENLEADFNTLSNEIDSILSDVNDLTTTTQNLSNEVSDLQNEYSFVRLSGEVVEDGDSKYIRISPTNKRLNYYQVPDISADRLVYVINLSPAALDYTIQIKTASTPITLAPEFFVPFAHRFRDYVIESGDDTFNENMEAELEADSEYLLAISDIAPTKLSFKLVKLETIEA